MSTILSYTDYLDWRGFLQEKLREDLRDRTEAAKRVQPEAIATSHIAFSIPVHRGALLDAARSFGYAGGRNGF